MGLAKDFEKEKLIVGILYSDEALLSEALSALTEEFGDIDAVSPQFSFSKEFSNYYDDELDGEGLRRIYSFSTPIEPQRQAEIKIFTNELEKRLSVGGKRHVNIDPGLINHGRLLLMTTKPTGFRIPISNGIYTELTLYWARGEWQKLPWTYRDYQSDTVKKFITEVRRTYLKQRKDMGTF